MGALRGSGPLKETMRSLFIVPVIAGLAWPRSRTPTAAATTPKAATPKCHTHKKGPDAGVRHCRVKLSSDRTVYVDPEIKTAAAGVAGGGRWGGRWSDGRGEAMGGTFGFAADDGSVSLLGAFSACHCASAFDSDPDDPVASRR